jgi:hypothetical protein
MTVLLTGIHLMRSGEFYERKFGALLEQLRKESEWSHLPEEPTAGDAFLDLLVRIRLKEILP